MVLDLLDRSLERVLDLVRDLQQRRHKMSDDDSQNIYNSRA